MLGGGGSEQLAQVATLDTQTLLQDQQDDPDTTSDSGSVNNPVIAGLTRNPALDDSDVDSGLLGQSPVQAAAGMTDSDPQDYQSLEGEGTPALSPLAAISVTPNTGSTTGGTAVTIAGSGFQAPLTAVTFGGTPATNFTINSDTQITATTPAHTAGVVDVVLTYGSGGPDTITAGYTYTPTITSVTPNTGTAAGGNTVTITGSGYYSPYVQFSNDQYIDTGINATGVYDFDIDFMPDNSSPVNSWLFGALNDATGTDLSGNFGVKVLNGSSLRYDTVTLPYTFLLNTRHKLAKSGTSAIYNGVTQSISTGNMSITPPYNIIFGSVTTGGTSATSKSYMFGGKIYAFKLYRDNTLVADYYPVAAGSTVYSATPAPGAGFWDAVSSTYKTVSGLTYGQDGSGVSAVTVGGNPCTNVNVISDTQLTCTAPASTLSTPYKEGTVDVAVTVNGVADVPATATADDYTYRAPMSISSVSPPTGLIPGGETVIISGHNFVPVPDFIDGANQYKQIDYLRFEGTQYIDTGIDQVANPFGTDMTVTATFQRNPGMTNMFVYGARSSTTLNISNTFTFLLYNSTYRVDYGSGTATIQRSLGTPDNDWHTVTQTNNTATVTGTGGGTASTTYTTAPLPANSLPMYLGAVNSPTFGGGYLPFKGKISAFSITKNGTLLADYVPVYNIATGATGMWDTVSQTFKVSSSTTPFAPYAPTVTFDGDPATVTAWSNDSITVTTPGHAPGIVDVVVNNGTESATWTVALGGFTYLANDDLN